MGMEFHTFGMPRGYRFGPKYGKLTIEQFTADVVEYFEHCEKTGYIPTMSGLAAHCGVWRTTFDNWSSTRRDDPAFQPFIDILDQAKAYIEADLVQCMIQGKHASPGAFTLILKNNHGFIEKTEQAITADVGVRQVVVNGIDPNP